jgi:MarR family 2-MHQ and catechol resistance regulon transcriptional repressor
MSEYQIDTTAATALKTFTKLIRAAETVTAEAHRLLPESGLTISQFGVLEALLHLGPLCQKEIAAKILKSTGNITQVIDNLEKRNLVIRKQNPDDRRYYAIHLTKEGRRFIAALFPEHAKRIAAAMSCLSTEEQQQLGKLCRKFKP